MDKIKLNISGHNDMTSQPWEEGWDAIHALAEAIDPAHPVLSDDSAISGRLRVSVASKSEVKRVKERLGAVVEVDSTLAQFEDKEVVRVISEKAGNGQIITKEACGKITSIETWFMNNAVVKFLDGEMLSGVQSVNNGSLAGCENLEIIDMSNIKTINISNASSQPVLHAISNNQKLKKVILKGCETINMTINYFASRAFDKCPSLEFVDLRNCKNVIARTYSNNSNICFGESVGLETILFPDECPIFTTSGHPITKMFPYGKITLRNQTALEKYLSNDTWSQLGEDRYVVDPTKFV